MVLKILQDGGPVMIVILLLSFVALVLIIERFLYFRKIEKNEKRFLEAVFPLLETRDFPSAEKLCACYCAHAIRVPLRKRCVRDC